MLKISNGLKENQYLRNCQDTVFTMMLRELVHTDESLEKFKNINFVHGLLGYPQWGPHSDIFQFILEEYLVNIQEKKTFFVFDSSTEGFSPINKFPFFDILYYNCEKYNVDPSMIIYVSSNLKDEENIKKYCKSNNKKPINVFSFLSFEKVVYKALNLEKEIEYCKSVFQDKYFSSLSRVLRQYRSMATFLLCHSEIKDKALISHSKFPKNINIGQWKRSHFLSEYDDKTIKRWFKTLPLTIDKTNFNDNWALRNDYYPIHRQTLFQIVNETLVDNSHDTSLFYSEKTFRPVVCFQPFVIYGQKGCNKHLKNLGYKTYEDWFDLSFDDEQDNVLRYKKLLNSAKDTCAYLDSLPRDKKIEWRFKNKELLEHNFLTMQNSEYSKLKLKNFVESLNDIVS